LWVGTGTDELVDSHNLTIPHRADGLEKCLSHLFLARLGEAGVEETFVPRGTEPLTGVEEHVFQSLVEVVNCGETMGVEE
jgi:hypothetical protein